MPVPVFTRQHANEPLFFLAMGGPPPGLVSYEVAFLPDPGQTLPNSVDLPTTWTTNKGIYLFLGSSVFDQSTLASAVRGFIGNSPVRFLWIANPGDPSGQWQTAQIQATPSGSLAQPSIVLFRNYLLFLGGGTAISLNQANDGFDFAASNGGIYFQTGSGTFTIPCGNSAALPFQGPAVGCMQFSLDLSDGNVPGFTMMDACIRYFVDGSWPTPDALTALTFPVLTLAKGATTLYPSLDPINPLVPQRSALYFLAPSASTGALFDSDFRDVYGSHVGLTPVQASGWPQGPSLAFAVLPTTTSPNPSDPFYLTFQGPFMLTIPPSTGGASQARMMCGISGVEYAGFATTSGNAITFFAGQPAYVLPSPPVGSPPLSNVAATAWGYVTSQTAGNAEYFAQPQDSVLYSSNLSTADPEAFLYCLEVFAGVFPTAVVPPPSPQATAFPIVPIGGLTSDLVQQARDLETQVLSPYRRNLLAGILLPTETGPDDPGPLGATPQGLLVQFDQNLRYWESLFLIRHKAGAQLLQVDHVKGGFKTALQSNQLFAVVSNRDEFLRCCTPEQPFTLEMDGWTFDFSPGHWGDNHTILLLKYAGDTLENLAADTSKWLWQAAANGWADGDGDLAAVQADLMAIIARAKQQQSGELKKFYDEIASDPTWTGVLFLRVTLSSGSFPPELQGLSAGLDAPLFAHHVGARATPIHNVAGVLQQDDSSISGLIDYNDPADLAFDNVDYAYKVLSLVVAFENSLMAGFSSQIELMVNRLFGDYASLNPATRGNNLVLNGSYQRQGDEVAFAFVGEGINTFLLERSVLSRVDVTRAQFVTVKLSTGPTDPVRTAFVLGGALFFEALPFDAFSFGPEPFAVMSTDSLRFTNLLVHMDFLPSAPAQFHFDAASMAFDLSQSVARSGSLYRHFPLKFTGLVPGSPGSSPGDMGYISVQSPLPQAKMADPWFALTFDLDLGTLGALAGDAGWTVNLLAAWTPRKGQRLTYIGLQLPGSKSARPEIPIEGVLKLSFSGIEFTVGDDAGSAYILHFRNMALRVLTLSFPPGQNEIALFGDPSGGASGALGWYAAYAKDEDEKPDPIKLRRRQIPALPGGMAE
ncbi:MAG TPA: hypothetical protein VHE55_00490 [Fimbriimonadaceae bacterium]|nr:hypothetical protein [Fimbriimonadaceae bacterium]